MTGESAPQNCGVPDLSICESSLLNCDVPDLSMYESTLMNCDVSDQSMYESTFAYTITIPIPINQPNMTIIILDNIFLSFTLQPLVKSGTLHSLGRHLFLALSQDLLLGLVGRFLCIDMS